MFYIGLVIPDSNPLWNAKATDQQRNLDSGEGSRLTHGETTEETGVLQLSPMNFGLPSKVSFVPSSLRAQCPVNVA
jgi:hypothetical protein